MAYEFAIMTPEQIDEFLLASRHAIVATNRLDGPPQISPVWYLYEDEKVFIMIGADSVKHRRLQRDPRISICVDGGHPDGRAVTIYGTAELLEDRTEWRDDISFRITRRYVESDQAAHEFNEEAASSTTEVLVVVTPTKILARDYN